jgi:two-component system, sensor histidine kinase and response regulator
MQPVKRALYLLVFGLTIIIVFGGIAAFLDIRRFEANLVEQTSGQMLAVARSESQSIGSFLNDVLDDLQAIALDQNIVSVLKKGSAPLSGPDDPRFSAFNIVARRHAARTTTFHMLDRNGFVIACYPYDEVFMGKDCSVEADILFALEYHQPNISDPFMLDENKQIVFSMTVPVFEGDEFVGLLRRVIPLSTLQDNVSGVEDAMKGTKVRAYIISDNGHLLYGSWAGLAGQKTVTAVVGGSGNYDKFIERMKWGEEGQEVGESISYSGKTGPEKVIIAFAPIRVGKQNWSVGVAMPYKTVSKPIVTHARTVFVFAGMILIGLVAGAIGFYDIQRKRDKMQADLETVHMLRGMNERLAAEVAERRRAQEALKQSHDELEVRVQQRTSDLVKANKDLEQEVNERKRLELLRDNLIHMVVHDLKSPLCGITGYLDLALQRGEGKLGKDLTYFIKEGLSSAEDLLEMINSLLDVNRMEAGKLPLNKCKSELTLLAERTITRLSSLAMGKEVKITAPEGGVWCICDPDIIYRVILNLLTNALKYVPDSGGKVRIVLSQENTRITLLIEDNGPGIPPEYHEKIFEKFGRVESQSAGNIYSTGIGLTFCKLAVEAHDGKIGVRSEVGKGSTFWVNLPTSGGDTQHPASESVESFLSSLVQS